MGGFDPGVLKQIVLLFFFFFFVGVILWVFASKRSRGFDHDAALPLNEGRPAGSPSAAGVEEHGHD